jgi:hypothetical protein
MMDYVDHLRSVWIWVPFALFLIFYTIGPWKGVTRQHVQHIIIGNVCYCLCLIQQVSKFGAKYGEELEE